MKLRSLWSMILSMPDRHQPSHDHLNQQAISELAEALRALGHEVQSLRNDVHQMRTEMSALTDSIAAFKASQDTLTTAVNALAAKAGTTTDPDLQTARDALDTATVGNTELTAKVNAAIDGTAPTGTAPSITGISPTSGSSSGGDSIVISGSGFTGASGVNFSGTNAASFSVLNDTTINAVTPPGTGTVDVTVTSPTGGKSASSPFTYN